MGRRLICYSRWEVLLALSPGDLMSLTCHARLPQAGSTMEGQGPALARQVPHLCAWQGVVGHKKMPNLKGLELPLRALRSGRKLQRNRKRGKETVAQDRWEGSSQKGVCKEHLSDVDREPPKIG